jgi:hypothetical protein
MPQLTNLQRQDRIRRRIDELEKGVEVAARDIDNLLTTEEQEQLAAAWAACSEREVSLMS